MQKMKATRSGGSSSDLSRASQASFDLLDLVEDEDLPAQVGGRVVDRARQVADVVDLVVRRGVDLEDVERPALTDSGAGRASVARFAVLEVRAVERLGDDPGHRGLAGAARSDEQERVRRRDPARTALRSVATTASWPTISPKVWARQRR